MMNEEKNFKVIGISGSLRKASLNTAALKAFQKLAGGELEVEIADISDIPMYNADLQDNGFSETVEKLAQKIKDADAVIIASPEYNYSVPGVLKNAIDWLSRSPLKPFELKPVAIMGASPGMLGTARMQYHLRQIFVFLNAYVMNKPEIMIAQANKKFDQDGNLNDEITIGLIKSQITELKKFIKIFAKNV